MPNTFIQSNSLRFSILIGLIKFAPQNCNSMSDGVCVKHVKRGQSVNLCTSHTTTPSTIPQGKHVINVSAYYWSLHIESNMRTLYKCYNGSCRPGSSNVGNFHYLEVSNSCLTIKNVQNNSEYILDIYYSGIGAQLYPNALLTVTFSVICRGMCEHE